MAQFIIEGTRLRSASGRQPPVVAECRAQAGESVGSAIPGQEQALPRAYTVTSGNGDDLIEENAQMPTYHIAYHGHKLQPCEKEIPPGSIQIMMLGDPY
jgi:hypothetical protein